MKKTCSLIALGLLTVSIHAQFNAEKTPFLTQSLAADNIKNILSETSGGSISVTGVAASEAKIEVYVVPNNYRKNDLSESEIRQRAESDYTLTISTSNNKLTVIARPKDKHMDWKKALNFSFKIFVPKNVSTDLSTSGGSISLKNLSGDLKFRTSGGSLNLEEVGGKIDGRTSGGSINLENSKDEIELSTSGGSIEARNCDGKLRLNTSGGSLNLSGLKGDIRATTSGGSVSGKNIEGELVTGTSGGSVHLTDLACSIEASTSGGSIDVSIKTLGKYVKLNNSGGNIDLTLPKDKGLDLDLSADKIRTDKMESFSGKSGDDEIVGKLNGGGVPVTVRAGSGRIYLGLK